MRNDEKFEDTSILLPDSAAIFGHDVVTETV